MESDLKMPKIQLNIPNDIDKELKLYQINNDLYDKILRKNIIKFPFCFISLIKIPYSESFYIQIITEMHILQ